MSAPAIHRNAPVLSLVRETPAVGHVTKCAHCGSLYEPARESIEAEALHLLADDLEGAHEDCWRFMRAVWSPARYTRLNELANDCAVAPSTLACRFWRAGLPSPKAFILSAMLTRAARMFERPHVRVFDVAYDLGYSGPSSFARTVRLATGLAPYDFRARYDGSAMLARFREELVLPYRTQMLMLAPLVGLGRVAGGRA